MGIVYIKRPVQCVGLSMRETRVSRIVKKVGNAAVLDASGRLQQRDRGGGLQGKGPSGTS